MVLDSEKLEKNASTLLKNFTNVKTILQRTDGEKSYQQIAKELGINSKIISPALSLAKELGFAEKIKPGIYKKITKRMRYIPNKKKSSKKIPINRLVKRFSKKGRKEEKIKTQYSLNFKNKVEKMVVAYKWLFITENTLRELIRTVLSSEEDWWKKRVPEDVRKKVEEAKLDCPYDDAKRKDELDYTHLGQLKEIMASKKNWNSFSPYLKKKDKKTFQVEIERVIPSRNSIGHCISLIGDDYKYAEMRFKAILKLLK